MANLIRKIGFIDPKKSLLMLCDIQDKFRPGMKYFDAMVQNSKKMVRIFLLSLSENFLNK